MALAREKFPGSQVSLDALCKRFRIDNSMRTTHNALLDCALLAKVYINLTDQKEPTLDFQKTNDQIHEEKQVLAVSYFKKVILPTKDEILSHKKYLKENLKKNYFS